MMTYGLHITRPSDELRRVKVDRVIQKIKQPTKEFEEQIRQLRIIKTIDEKRYKQQKVLLPYFVCSTFHPLIRKKENFAAAYHMIVDIDHCARENIDIHELKKELSEDKEIRCIFISPGGDGLKVLFDFDERVTDPGLYEGVYKSHLMKFSEKYGIEHVIDFVTHDVTRACFFSADREAWINPSPEPLKINQWIESPRDDLFYDVNKTFNKKTRQIDKPPKEEKSTVQDDVLDHIKQKLFPKRPKKVKNNIFVPDELKNIGNEMAAYLQELNIKLASETPIHYGKKMRLEAGRHFAEINIFYGKKGFKVIKTTKSGSNDELADLAVQAIENFISEEKQM